MADDQPTFSSLELDAVYICSGDNSPVTSGHTSPTTHHHTLTHSFQHAPTYTGQEGQYTDSVDNTDTLTPADVLGSDAQDITDSDVTVLPTMLDSPDPHLRVTCDTVKLEHRLYGCVSSAPDGVGEVCYRCHADDATSRQGFSTPSSISNALTEFHSKGEPVTPPVPVEPCAECRDAFPLELHPPCGTCTTEHRPNTPLSSPKQTLEITSPSCAEDFGPGTPSSPETVHQGEIQQPSPYHSFSDDGCFTPLNQSCDTPALNADVLSKPTTLSLTEYNPGHRPPLLRARPMVGDKSPVHPSLQEVLVAGVKPQASSATSRLQPQQTRATSTPPVQIGNEISGHVTGTLQDNSDAEKDTCLSLPAKRVRRKAYTTSFGVEKSLPEILEDPVILRSLDESLCDEDKYYRQTVMKVAVREVVDPVRNSWNDGELIDVNMKILNDQRQVPNKASYDASPKDTHLQSESYDTAGMTVVNIVHDGESDGLVGVESGFTCDDQQSDRSGKLKSVIFYVEEEEVGKIQTKKVINETKESMNKVGGQENLGFIADEPDTVSQGGPEDQLSPESPRRSSDPECLSVVKNEIFRSGSCGTELDQVLNNLNGDHTSPVTPPTLRKRSTSKGRPEYSPSDSEGTEKQEETSFSSKEESKKEKKQTSLRPTFYVGNEDNTPGILQKLISNPFIKLARSESTKSTRSNMAPPLPREQVLSRSISNIYEVGTRARGSGSSGHHTRPPQAPSSMFRDDHRHLGKSYILQKPLYRNSRRNVQQKLHRQLSEPRYDDSRYSDYYRDDYYHKKHDTYSDHHHGHSRHGPHGHSKHGHHDHSDHHSHSGRSKHSHHDHSEPHSHSGPTKHSPHDHPNHHNCIRHDPTDPHRSPHHHRSLSQRSAPRPKHEPLRRLNTYAHEEYHKYVTEHEHRCDQDHTFEHEQGHDSGYQRNQEGAPVRKVSHYRQEEKGRTDVERWVGVHGGQSSDGPAGNNIPGSPTTPHIVVSTEDETNDVPTNNENPGADDSPVSTVLITLNTLPP
ncbi:uncharacterized protein LOC121863254 isoform X2 [Homarus americanus]|uniref:uncharacterized protein LOC121863254 isoform X2 n=1 Tax=Homarus americanus TaxID=6706 RepID=UPI001C47A60C|nr:uncharacterized protein LOC121863254 isoform X2 [Homarus americanus]